MLFADPGLFAIIALSLFVSTSAVIIAAIVGIPTGALIALTQFPGKAGVVVLLNALMGLPPVVLGLMLYLLLSRAGPLGFAQMLFTPQAMILAQTLLVLPIVTALTRQTIEDRWTEYRDELTAMNVSTPQRVATLLREARFSLLTALLAGFGRAVGEVGAVIIVGGNIAGYTRTMTTAVALEASKGNLWLAIELGVVLMVMVVLINIVAGIIRRTGERLAA